MVALKTVLRGCNARLGRFPQSGGGGGIGHTKVHIVYPLLKLDNVTIRKRLKEMLRSDASGKSRVETFILGPRSENRTLYVSRTALGLSRGENTSR